MENINKVAAIQYKDGIVNECEETVVKDETLELKINETITRSLSGITDSLKEFITGYMLAEGLIGSIEDIKSLKIDGNKVEAEIDTKKIEENKEKAILCSDSSGGLRRRIGHVDSVESDLTVSKDEIIKNMTKLTKNAKIWQATGGCHVAAIVSEDKFIVKEDVSRHVAVDKAIGAGAYEGLDFSKSYIIYSGRMPADMVVKVARVGIPILISNASPANSGIRIAKEGNITLVGFVRSNRFNVYTSTDRIIFE